MIGIQLELRNWSWSVIWDSRFLRRLGGYAITDKNRRGSTVLLGPLDVHCHRFTRRAYQSRLEWAASCEARGVHSPYLSQGIYFYQPKDGQL